MRPRGSICHAQTIWLAVIDIACLVVSFAAGVKTREILGIDGALGFDPLKDSFGSYVYGHISGWIYFCGSIILANYVAGTYGVRLTTSRFNLFVNWLFSLVVALFVVSVTSYAWFALLLGRGVLLFAVVAYASLSLVSKAIMYGVVLRSRFFVCRTAVLSSGVGEQEARRMVEERSILPVHRVCAYLRVSDPAGAPAGDQRDAGTVPVLDVSVETLEDTVRRFAVDLIVVEIRHIHEVSRYYPALRRLRFSGIEVVDFMAAAELYSGRIPLELVDEVWLMHASMASSLAVVARLKRFCDLLAVILGSVVLVPVGVVVAAFVKWKEPHSPVFYFQDRVGRFGKVFRMYKFRTMVCGAEVGVGPVWSPANDPRVTRVGRVLRKFRLDEIPQLFNILRGDMSIVGPRPERPQLAAELDKRIPYYRERENVPPGLTGWAQVRYPYTDKVEDAARKLEFDLYYVKNFSLRLDVQIVLRTLRIVLLGKERSV